MLLESRFRVAVFSFYDKRVRTRHTLVNQRLATYRAIVGLLHSGQSPTSGEGREGEFASDSNRIGLPGPERSVNAQT